MTRRQYIKPEIQTMEVDVPQMMATSQIVEGDYIVDIETGDGLDTDDELFEANPDYDVLGKGSGDDWDSLW